MHHPLSQIKFDKKERYDPNLTVKIPFRSNRYEVDIKSEDSESSLTRIYNFSKLKCDIWFNNFYNVIIFNKFFRNLPTSLKTNNSFF